MGVRGGRSSFLALWGMALKLKSPDELEENMFIYWSEMLSMVYVSAREVRFSLLDSSSWIWLDS